MKSKEVGAGDLIPGLYVFQQIFIYFYFTSALDCLHKLNSLLQMECVCFAAKDHIPVPPNSFIQKESSLWAWRPICDANQTIAQGPDEDILRSADDAN